MTTQSTNKQGYEKAMLWLFEVAISSTNDLKILNRTVNQTSFEQSTANHSSSCAVASHIIEKETLYQNNPGKRFHSRAKQYYLVKGKK